MARGALIVLALLSSVAGLSADCVSGGECQAVKARSASLLQLKVQRNQAEVDLVDQEHAVVAQSPQQLLQTVQRLVDAKLQTFESPGANESNESGGNQSNVTPTEEPDTYFAVVRNAVNAVMIPHILSGLKADQQILDAAHDRLLGCAHDLSAEEEAAGVGTRHSAHDSCRTVEAELYVDKMEKCRVFYNYVEDLGEVPGSPNGLDYPTLVKRWRAYFARAAPLVEAKYAQFKVLDDACTQAEEKWSDQRDDCDIKQSAYEAVVCDTVQHRKNGMGQCLQDKSQEYNDTIKSVASSEGDRCADYVALKRIVCYVTAIENEENFQQAVHDCHGLLVDSRQCKISYPGWPPMPKDMDASKMYPCGKIWLSYAYGGLPFYAPHAECKKCPNLPDLDGAGSVFVQWGSVSCPDDTELIYKGCAAGGQTGEHGNGANFICLTEQVTDAPDSNSGNNNHAKLYGAQYYDHYAGGSYTNHGDVGCSLCAFQGTTYTVWGKQSCPSGQVKMYHGNVMSNHHGNYRGEYVCVNDKREVHFKSSNGNQAGPRWYLAEYECGSLPCASDAFNGEWEVSCAVCGIPDQLTSVYTRWGNNDCPDGSDKLYTGVVGGTHYSQHGAGYNNLCLTPDPEKPAKIFANGHQNHAHLYGTEYEGAYAGRNPHDHDAGCSVCVYKGKTSYTVWGTTQCGDGHSLLYKGNVFGEHHKRAEWVCVDPARSVHWKNNGGNQNGNLWYLAEYECGSLPCGKYNTHWEVACAVCGVPDDYGSVFTRWGHNDCPASSKRVYSGFAANGAHNNWQGAANPLCLSGNPENAPDNHGSNNNVARLYGVEYQGIYAGNNHNSWDAACALCAYEGSTTYEAWGTINCGEDHDVLYMGNVMAGHHGHQKENYICVDPERELAVGGNKGNQGGAYWYLAEYECGSLPCDPYDTHKEVACAVCGIPGFGFSTRCSGFGSEEVCPKGQCSWVRNSCQVACLTHRTNTSCLPTCTWDSEYAVCNELCQDYTTKDVCPVGRCIWSGDICSPLGMD